MAKTDPYEALLAGLIAQNNYEAINTPAGPRSNKTIEAAINKAAKSVAKSVGKSAYSQSTGSAGLGVLKKLGSGALKTLSVPQAALFTVATKAGHAIAPDKVKDASWKNLGGGWYKGYKGGSGVLDAYGVDNGFVKKWGGLGLDIAADPLWFVGAGAVTKAGKATKFSKADLSGLGKVDELGAHANPFKDLEQVAKMHVKSVETPERQLAIRFGTRKHGKDVKIPFANLKAKKIKQEAPGKFRQKPAQEAAARILRSGTETAGHSGEMIRKAFGQKFNLTDQQDVIARLLTTGAPDQRAALEAVVRELPEWSDSVTGATSYAIRKGEDASRAQIGKTRKELLDERLAEVRDIAAREIDPMLPQAERLAASKAKLKAQGLAERLAAKGDYVHQGMNEATREAMKAANQARVDAGLKPVTETFKPGKSSYGDVLKKRKFEDLFSATTADDFAAEMRTAGFSDDSVAKITNAVQDRFAKQAQFVEGTGVRYQPEWRLGASLAEGTESAIKHKGQSLAEDALRAAGVTEGSPMWLDAITKRTGYNASPEALLAPKTKRRYDKAMSGLKSFYTTVNPGHFFGNLWGDLFNSNVNGNLRHLFPSALPKGKFWKLADHDAAMLAKEFKVSDDVVQTGAEMLAQGHLMGIGRGFVGGETAVKETGRSPMAIMGRLNNRRENAQRVGTWFKHVQGGDDPLTAAEKTLRVHFDYKNLTPFEETWMRNVFLFYTWMKRNALLQPQGMAMKPALYDTFANDMERARPKFANEPDYYSKQGVLSTPWGAVSFMNPMSDLYKFDLSGDSFRKDVLGAGNPFWRVPVELATNQQFFTGAPIKNYDGQLKQHWTARFSPWAKNTTAGEGSQAAPGLEPWQWYLANQLGPLGNSAQTVSDPNTEKSKNLELLGRLFSMKLQQNEPEKFERARKAQAARKKADETRARNAQGG